MSTDWKNSLRTSLLKRTWRFLPLKSCTQVNNVSSQPSRPIVSWVTSKAARSTEKVRWFCSSTPSLWEPTWNIASSPGVLSTTKTWTCYNGSRGEHEDDQRDGTFLLWRQAGRDRVVQPREGIRETTLWSSSTLRRFIKRMGRKFLCGQIVTGQRAIVLNWKRKNLG